MCVCCTCAAFCALSACCRLRVRVRPNHFGSLCVGRPPRMLTIFNLICHPACWWFAGPKRHAGRIDCRWCGGGHVARCLDCARFGHQRGWVSDVCVCAGWWHCWIVMLDFRCSRLLSSCIWLLRLNIASSENIAICHRQRICTILNRSATNLSSSANALDNAGEYNSRTNTEPEQTCGRVSHETAYGCESGVWFVHSMLDDGLMCAQSCVMYYYRVCVMLCVATCCVCQSCSIPLVAARCVCVFVLHAKCAKC